MSGGKSFVVIGGGVSGMSAALVLAGRGHAVTVVEKKPRLGPLLRGFSRQGARFDTGLHYVGGLGEKGVLTRYLGLLGITGLPLEDFNPAAFDRIRFTGEGREIALPVGYDALVASLCRDFPRDAAFIRRYHIRLRDAFRASVFLDFSGGLREAMDETLHQQSLAQVLAEGSGDPLLRAVLSIHSLLYGVSPEETPFMQHARVAGSYFEGVKTLRGGGKTLARAFEKRLRETGVAIICGAGASRLLFSPQGAATDVVLEDERRVPADGVVYTAHPALLPAMLRGGPAKPAFLRRLSALEDTFSTYALFGKSDTPVGSLRGSNLFVCPGTDIAPAFLPGCRPEDGPFYITGGSRGAGAEAAPGPEADTAPFSVMAFAPGDPAECAPWAESRPGARPKAYLAFKKRRLESLRARLTSLAPELDRVCFIDGGTPLTNRDWLETPGGGLYGTKHSLRQFSPLPATRAPNLWMAGQSVVAPGVLGAIISAFVACGFIVGMETIRKEIAAWG